MTCYAQICLPEASYLRACFLELVAPVFFFVCWPCVYKYLDIIFLCVCVWSYNAENSPWGSSLQHHVYAQVWSKTNTHIPLYIHTHYFPFYMCIYVHIIFFVCVYIDTWNLYMREKEKERLWPQAVLAQPLQTQITEIAYMRRIATDAVHQKPVATVPCLFKHR